MTKKPNARKDEIELAKSIFDEIVEETESEDWNKEKGRVNKKDAPSKSKTRKSTSITSTNSGR